MTEQELFDTAFAGILKQRAYAYRDHMCRYFDTHTGNRCHIGLLFTPEEAQVLEERYGGQGAYFAVRLTPLQPHTEFLRRLQQVHDELAEMDNPFDLARYHAAMCVFAQRHGLTLPTLPKETTA